MKSRSIEKKEKKRKGGREGGEERERRRRKYVGDVPPRFQQRDNGTRFLVANTGIFFNEGCHAGI